MKVVPLAAQQVSRTFAQKGGAAVEAVQSVDLAISAGEFVVLAGPSGSGKTTLLHLLAAIDTPTAGTVTIEDVDVSALTRAERADLRLRRIGIVFAERNLSPALTVGENVDLPLALRRQPTSERRRRVAEALERVGVAALIDRFPETLSSGEEQRVAVARALAGEPALLVADEPTSHLDTAAGGELVALLQDLARSGVAVIVASHDPVVVEAADRVLHMRDGRVGADG